MGILGANHKGDQPQTGKREHRPKYAGSVETTEAEDMKINDPAYDPYADDSPEETGEIENEFGDSKEEVEPVAVAAPKTAKKVKSVDDESKDEPKGEKSDEKALEEIEW